MTKKRFFFLTLCILSFALLVYIFLPPQLPLSPLSPLPPQPSTIDHRPLTILGFLPYWNLKKLTPEASDTITHLAYFTLHLSDSGELVKLENAREQDPGYTNYQRLLSERSICSPNYASANYDDSQVAINQPCSSLLLTFMPYDQDALTSILSSSANRRRAVTTILTLLESSGAVGVNVDFEPLGNTSPSLRNNFTLFIQELQQSLTSNIFRLKPMLSISIYPSAAARPRLWDLVELAPLTDFFVVMTYDYTMPGSPKTGPNSPLRGAGDLFEHDILKNLAELTAVIPSPKILLGIPFYGYEWDAESNEKYVPTQGRAAVASLERIQQLIDDNTLELLWDRNSLTPYAIRRDEGEIVSQIYYESIDSIRLKLDLVKQAGLGGIAIWALGYEGNNPALWSTINSLNN